MTDQEYTGGSVSYYTCSVTHPISETEDPYDAECIDIIDALQMTPNEANAFKALWRRAAARLGKSKRGYTDGLYDAEKVEFYGKRLVELERRGYRGPFPIAPAGTETIRLDIEFPSGTVSVTPAADPFGPRDADGWYAWSGDDTMRPAGQVFYEMRYGGKGRDNAENLEWVHNQDAGDIVKWRPSETQVGIDPVRPPKKWEVGTKLRRTCASSAYFTQGREYEIVRLTESGHLLIIDNTGCEHGWTEREARQRFERA